MTDTPFRLLRRLLLAAAAASAASLALPPSMMISRTAYSFTAAATLRRAPPSFASALAVGAAASCPGRRRASASSALASSSPAGVVGGYGFAPFRRRRGGGWGRLDIPAPSRATTAAETARRLSSSPPPDFTVLRDDDDGDGDMEGGRPPSMGGFSVRPADASGPGSPGWDPNVSFGEDVPPEFAADEYYGGGGGGGRSVGAASGRYESRPSDYEYGDVDDEDEGGGSGKKRLRRGRRDRSGSVSGARRERGGGGEGGEAGGGRSFREDFRGTRVFVQDIPLHVRWPELKDHFRIAGEVVFASVSVDSSGKSKGCGIVQFETTEMALNAIKIMRNHPLDGGTLYVREDYQEEGGRGATGGRSRGGGGGGAASGRGGGDGSPPSTWRCADESGAAAALSDEDLEEVRRTVRARDGARRRRDYGASDAMREELRGRYGVHLDDRLKLWWVAEEGGVPDAIREIKGEGRWGKRRPWRQIPTTPENDALVNPDRVEYLLNQRDLARREKNFVRADALLEEARNSPGDGNLHLRIHDESRTWRIWTDEPPPRAVQGADLKGESATDQKGASAADQKGERMSAAEQCLALVQERDPAKLGEIKMLLKKFPGREFNMLKKLRQRFDAEDVDRDGTED